VKRLPLTDAFVDESVRGRRYLMACVMAEARHLPEMRLTMRDLALHQRVHFNNESTARKRVVLSVIARMPIDVLVVVAQRGHGVTEFTARNACLAAIVQRVQGRRIPLLVVESRDDDREDERQLVRVRQPEPWLSFEHRQPNHEPMLWVADAIAWAQGAGNHWRTLIEPVVDEVVELRP
jgi:hypothetical protein